MAALGCVADILDIEVAEMGPGATVATDVDEADIDEDVLVAVRRNADGC